MNKLFYSSSYCLSDFERSYNNEVKNILKQMTDGNTYKFQTDIETFVYPKLEDLFSNKKTFNIILMYRKNGVTVITNKEEADSAECFLDQVGCFLEIHWDVIHNGMGKLEIKKVDYDECLFYHKI